ncbi:MAG: hypothetical protein ACREWE_05060 [Gammaproteobacteria bacterium]
MQGQLFTHDFLTRGILDTDPWRTCDDAARDGFIAALCRVYGSMAPLDALFVHLYGLGEADADYILATFPIVREKDEAAFGTYRTRDLILAYLQRIEKGLLSHAGM